MNKELENAIKVSKNLVDFYNSEDYDCFEALSYNEINAIETVLTELKRLQEENTQYKRIKKIADSVTQEEVEEAIKRAEKEFIAKDKIREKIEELKNDRETKYDNFMGYRVESREQQDIDKKIKILEELLEGK